jgi:hypothetical protein
MVHGALLGLCVLVQSAFAAERKNLRGKSGG